MGEHMDIVLLGLVILLIVVPCWKGWGRYRSAVSIFLPLIVMTLAWIGIVTAEAEPSTTFNERDTRVFKAFACTKDSKPVEALYYIVASRSDMSEGKPSPSAQLMKDEVENNWRGIASQLTMDQILEERFADTYHALLTEMVRHLQQAVKQKSDVSISVSEVNSRAMDTAKDHDVPACSQLSG
jgi:hypothetical protein